MLIETKKIRIVKLKTENGRTEPANEYGIH
jgi:hypothetical protein